MVTKQQVMMLRKRLERQKKEIERVEAYRKLEEEATMLRKQLKRSKNPNAILRQQKTKRILRGVSRSAKVTGRGLSAFGRGTLKFIDSLPSIPQEETRRKPIKRRKVRKTTRKRIRR